MCDTLTALGPATADGRTLFAKNSDRERNEAQGVSFSPVRRSAPGTRLKATYVEIDETPQTFACLLSRPFWMWGAEMGANDRGVVIGNEAMHALVPPSRTPALTGMDLVRLGLERGATARAAVAVITDLLEQHGQGGNCGHLNPFHYHNGFIIADPTEAYVLETVGRWWIVEKVAGARALSNALSIGEARHAISPALLEHARAGGWTDGADRFDFADRLIDPVKDAATFGRGRCARAGQLLAARTGTLTLPDLMAVLRDHGEEADGDPDWSPRKTRVRSICMHAASGARRSQSVAAMASDLGPDGARHWVTATSATCLSLFRPIGPSLTPPPHGPLPTDRHDPQSLWWRHERFHRRALADFPAALAELAPERDAAEADFRHRMDTAWTLGPDAADRAAADCWAAADQLEAVWMRRLLSRPAPRRSAIGRSASLAWARLNTTAGLPPVRS
jgi:dipeptidase